MLLCMQERDQKQQLRKSLVEAESDCESVVGVENPFEQEDDFLEKTVHESSQE